MADPTFVGMTGASPLSTTGTAQSAAARRQEESKAAWQEEMGRIKDMGFSAYVEQMNKEKLEKMREEILKRMGLSEEDLSQMPNEQRATIEKMIAEEIQRRLAANSLANSDTGNESLLTRTTEQSTASGAPTSAATGLGDGWAMLRAQEYASRAKGHDKDDSDPFGG